jgi:hypothetical protein
MSEDAEWVYVDTGIRVDWDAIFEGEAITGADGDQSITGLIYRIAPTEGN